MCDDDIHNGFYILKRELKNIIRYDIQHSDDFIQHIKKVSYNIANLEFEYIENIIQNSNAIYYKNYFIKELLVLLLEFKYKLIFFKQEAYSDKILKSLKMAIRTTNQWKGK